MKKPFQHLKLVRNRVAKFAYDAFGKTVTQTGSKSSIDINALNYRFSTKPMELELATANTTLVPPPVSSGLYYYGYRFYSPNLVRWISRDPIREKGGRNRYNFVGNDGVDQWDILGNVTYHKNLGMTVDYDGSSRAYHPKDSPPGLDNLKNAGFTSFPVDVNIPHREAYGIAKDNKNILYIQGKNGFGPSPGFFVSQTAYFNTSYPENDQRRYIDAENFPYIVNSGGIGKLATVLNLKDLKNPVYYHAVVGDVHGGFHGEASIYLSKAFGFGNSGTNNGKMCYLIYDRKISKFPSSVADIDAEASLEYRDVKKDKNGVSCSCK